MTVHVQEYHMSRRVGEVGSAVDSRLGQSCDATRASRSGASGSVLRPHQVRLVGSLAVPTTHCYIPKPHDTYLSLPCCLFRSLPPRRPKSPILSAQTPPSHIRSCIHIPKNRSFGPNHRWKWCAPSVSPTDNLMRLLPPYPRNPGMPDAYANANGNGSVKRLGCAAYKHVEFGASWAPVVKRTGKKKAQPGTVNTSIASCCLPPTSDSAKTQNLIYNKEILSYHITHSTNKRSCSCKPESRLSANFQNPTIFPRFISSSSS